ncbi:MAG: nucleotidyltransferase family protein [Longimicrobiales bacterium]
MIAPTPLERLRKRRSEILAVAARHGVANVRVFGSVAHGRVTESSDVDLVVTFPAGASLLDQVAFQQELEDLLEREVDVVSEPALHWFIRDRVLEEAVAL